MEWTLFTDYRQVRKLINLVCTNNYLINLIYRLVACETACKMLEKYNISDLSGIDLEHNEDNANRYSREISPEDQVSIIIT